MTIFATKEAFLRLGLEQIKPNHSHASQDCSICLDPMEVHPSPTKDKTSKLHPAVRIISCRHILGEECLEAWLQVGNTCPTCNRYLFEVTEDAITQRDVNAVLSNLAPIYGEFDVMNTISRIIAKREKEHAQLRERQAEQVAKMARENEARSSESSMSEADFYDSDEDGDSGFDEDMEDYEDGYMEDDEAGDMEDDEDDDMEAKVEDDQAFDSAE